ncbi:MAG TPA: 2OG-Fe(II) oxygenase [Allosphingosinicella sp.]|nr:2OG-Fe(II) oxygenase [Allosphingosinicella sp.]
MERAAEQLHQAQPATARDRAQRQLTSLNASAGWLLATIEPHAALLPQPDASPATRLRRAARTLSWTTPEQERLALFAERFLGLEAESARALAADGGEEELSGLALRLEQASAEALSFYMTMQGQAAQAPELSRAIEAEENSPPRLGARAEIGAGVRTRLRERGAVKLAAMGLELYLVPRFLDEPDCEALIELIDRDLIPSGVLGEERPGFRTSKSCNLSPADEPVAAFERKVVDLVGINPRFMENVQGQRYDVSQEFKPHYDFFHSGQSYYSDVTERGGQRTWTAMLFLNRPEAGGYTGFPNAGVDAVPETGTLVVWNNMAPDGRPNTASLHHGMPVEAGVKYVLTKWFRERPMIF